MNYAVIFHPEAFKELRDAYQWYEQILDGLGEKFLKAVDNCIQSVESQPESFSKKKRQYREANVNNFPYVVVFEVLKRKKEIFVLSIFHTKRNPTIKYKR